VIAKGELVCFFRAPPRIVRNPLQDISVSPDRASRSTDAVPRLFQSPALLSDAVRRLGLAATDRLVKSVDSKRAEDGDTILRIMTNLLTFSHHNFRRDAEQSKPFGGIAQNYSLLPPHRSTIFINNTTDTAGADKKVATDYLFEADSLSAVCEKNALIARQHGRYDHERVFRILSTLVPTSQQNIETSGKSWKSNPLIREVITGL
jgi:hypothetical protein